MAMSDGELIKSQKWFVGGHDWEVHWRPKNHWAGRHRPVTLNLILLSEERGGDVKAKLSCRLVDLAGRLKPSEEKTISHKLYKSGDYSGPLEVMGREELEASGYLADDSYTVQCSIAVLKEAPTAVPNTAATAMDRGRRPDAASPSLDLHRHLGELLQKGTGMDVMFHVSGEKFTAHKAILASRSPVFMAKLFEGMKEEASPRIAVKDMEPAASKALLRFVYTDMVLELDQEGDDADATSMAQHLLAGADRYSLDRLKLIYEGRLADHITVDTAATMLALAEQHGCSQLKASCIEFIAGYLDAILETEGYKHLETSCPRCLLNILKVVFLLRDIGPLSLEGVGCRDPTHAWASSTYDFSRCRQPELACTRPPPCQLHAQKNVPPPISSVVVVAEPQRFLDNSTLTLMLSSTSGARCCCRSFM